MNKENKSLNEWAAEIHEYAAALWMCYRRNRPETSDKLLYAAFAVLIFGIREAWEALL